MWARMSSTRSNQGGLREAMQRAWVEAQEKAKGEQQRRAAARTTQLQNEEMKKLSAELQNIAVHEDKTEPEQNVELTEEQGEELERKRKELEMMKHEKTQKLQYLRRKVATAKAEEEKKANVSDSIMALFRSHCTNEPVPKIAIGTKIWVEVGGLPEGFLLSCVAGPKNATQTEGDMEGDTKNSTLEERDGQGAEDEVAARLHLEVFPVGKSPTADAVVQYMSEAIFQNIMRRKLSDTAAFMSGQVVVKGDMRKLDYLASVYEKVMNALDEADLDAKAGASAEAREEARVARDKSRADAMAKADENIIAMLKPAQEPRNPCTREFWKRHLGTDMLVGSWLLLSAGIIYVGIEIYKVSVSSQCMYGCLSKNDPRVAQMNNWSQLISSGGSVIATLAFIHLSYPEEFARIVVQAARVNPEELTFCQKYFTGNELLIAVWCIVLAAAPLVVGALVMIIEAQKWYDGYLYLAWASGIVLLTGLWAFACMPEHMLANEGQGSSVLYNKLLAPIMSACCCSEKARNLVFEHLGSDFLVGAWTIFVCSCVFSLSTVVNIVTVYRHITDSEMGLLWSTVAMGVVMTAGTSLVVLTTYPENMHDARVWTFFFDEKTDRHEIEAMQPEAQPLLDPADADRLMESGQSGKAE